MDKKRMAGEKAAEYVKDGMVVGLGTGSTAFWAIRKLGELVSGGLSIRAIPTSEHTKGIAMRLGIPLITFEETEYADLTIDGADEIDLRFNLIKGGGGALFREKLVALSSKRTIIVADDSKLVSLLGAFLLPVEVVPFGWRTTAKHVAKFGCRPLLRRVGENPYFTDNGNFILDCDFGAIHAPAVLNQSLKLITGVVETGLFLGIADAVIVGTDSGVAIREKPHISEEDR